MFWHLLRCVDIDFGLRCISARIIIEALAESWLHSEWSWCTWDNRKPEHWDITTIQSLVLTNLERLSQARHTKVECFIMASASLFHLGRNGAQFCKSKHITCHDFGLESNPAVEQQHIFFEKNAQVKLCSGTQLSDHPSHPWQRGLTTCCTHRPRRWDPHWAADKPWGRWDGRTGRHDMRQYRCNNDTTYCEINSHRFFSIWLETFSQ